MSAVYPKPEGVGCRHGPKICTVNSAFDSGFSIGCPADVTKLVRTLPVVSVVASTPMPQTGAAAESGSRESGGAGSGTHQCLDRHVQASLEQRTSQEESAAALLCLHARTLLYRFHRVMETGRHAA